MYCLHFRGIPTRPQHKLRLMDEDTYYEIDLTQRLYDLNAFNKYRTVQRLCKYVDKMIRPLYKLYFAYE